MVHISVCSINLLPLPLEEAHHIRANDFLGCGVMDVLCELEYLLTNILVFPIDSDCEAVRG